MYNHMYDNSYNKLGTAFDRPAYMNIINNTTETFKFYNVVLNSGHLNTQPPKTIKPDENGFFQGMNSGLTGSAGTVTYSMNLKGQIIYLTVYWTHPEGSGSSIYYGYSSPFGVLFIIPQNKNDSSQEASYKKQTFTDMYSKKSITQDVLTLIPSGHSQSVNYLVKFTLA